jgi:large subunit ribosomal protein L23
MNIIIKPLISEKMTKLTEAAAHPMMTRIQRKKGVAESVAHNRYGFIVDKRANKVEIKKSIEEIYKVTVVDVNSMNYRGKNKSRYTKGGYLQGRTNAVKKAIITLAPGESIDFYAGI